MTFASFDTVFYTLSFVVPGFIGYSVVAALTPRRPGTTDMSLLRFFTFSCLNYAIWAGPLYWAARSEFHVPHPILAALMWAVVILVSPIVLGSVVGLLSQRETVRKLLRRLRVYTLHSTPTAWDYVFSNARPGWILVTLSDGSTVCGYFGLGSFASSESNERDLFLEKAYRIPEGEGSVWAEVPRSDGVWVPGREIRHIEFRTLEEGTTNG